MPDVGLSTDLIVGFPGETEEDYRETEAMVREIGFDTAFTFKFSPRPSTPAASMPEQVPGEVKQERLERLIQAQHETLRTHLPSMVGRTVEVFIDGTLSPSASSGRAPNGRVVVVHAALEPGSSAMVRVTEIRGHTLHGVPHKEA